jgi:hypothetical protein
MKAEPTYKHDCKVCRFLGQVVTAENTVDLYFCDPPNVLHTVVQSVVARYGDGGPSYASSDISTLNWTAPSFPSVYKSMLTLAAALAHANGLTTKQRSWHPT